MQLKTTTQCSHCEMQHNTVIDNKKAEIKGVVTVRCDLEFGGCGERYVVLWQISVSTKTLIPKSVDEIKKQAVQDWTSEYTA